MMDVFYIEFRKKGELTKDDPLVDSFVKELKQAFSYQSLNTVNEGIWSFN